MKIPNIHTKLAPAGHRLHLFLHRHSNEVVISMLVVLLIIVVWGNHNIQYQNQTQITAIREQAEDINRQLSILEGQAGARDEENKEIIEELQKHTRYLECVITAMGQDEVAENPREECREQTGFTRAMEQSSPVQSSQSQNSPPNRQTQNNQPMNPPGLLRLCDRIDI